MNKNSKKYILRNKLKNKNVKTRKHERRIGGIQTPQQLDEDNNYTMFIIKSINKQELIIFALNEISLLKDKIAGIINPSLDNFINNKYENILDDSENKTQMKKIMYNFLDLMFHSFPEFQDVLITVFVDFLKTITGENDDLSESTNGMYNRLLGSFYNTSMRENQKPEYKNILQIIILILYREKIKQKVYCYIDKLIQFLKKNNGVKKFITNADYECLTTKNSDGKSGMNIIIDNILKIKLLDVKLTADGIISVLKQTRGCARLNDYKNIANIITTIISTKVNSFSKKIGSKILSWFSKSPLSQ
jgi:hypothetical protein